MLLNLACLAGLIATSSSCAVTGAVDGCLPAGVQSNTVVEVVSRLEAGQVIRSTITVQDKLRELKATCRKRGLVDHKGKPVHFYRLRGCWGVPPPDYQQILEKQEKDIEELKKNAVVVEIPCNPDPLLPPAAIKPGPLSTIEF